MLLRVLNCPKPVIHGETTPFTDVEEPRSRIGAVPNFGLTLH
jgi:hypothetical protein